MPRPSASAGFSKVSIQSDSIADLERALGHVFADKGLLEIALTHSSVLNAPANNERLEFLGDRVLSLAMAGLLYASYPAEREGDLAKRHAALVAKSALLGVAAKLGLDAHIRLSRGEVKSGGAKKDTILADCLEALIGAIFLDGGYAPAAAFVHAQWRGLVATHAVPPEDAKSSLQVWAQQRGLPLPEYKLKSRAGSDHQPVFEIEVTVKGREPVAATAASKQAAEKEAALKMLTKIAEG